MSGQWLVCHRPKPNARLRLVCFPYAGGGSSAFAHWDELLPDDVELHAVRLPGRESRLMQPAHTSMDGLLPPLVEALSDRLREPYVLFGHSMGALIAYEVCRRLRAGGHPGPERLIVSARAAPHLPRTRPLVHHLPDEEFLARLRDLGGTPAEVLADPRVMRLVLPGLRADFELNDAYRHRPGGPLSCPVTAFGGWSDPVVGAQGMAGWARHTTAGFGLRMYDGGHFFLHTARDEVVREVARALAVVPV